MRILVIGSGGREHALAWKLAQSPHVKQMWSAPGNPGISSERLKSNQDKVESVAVAADDLPALLSFAQEKKIDLTVVGPDNPLALGVVDLFQKNQLKIWGPNKQAAQFESSKVFAQEFMSRHGIPSARSGIFSASKPAQDFARSLDGQCAVKADGLALGKGVIICTSASEAEKAIADMLDQKKFGSAGTQIVIQELLEGMEISLHALCDGKTAKLFPTSQDHKRVFEGDQGPNTGGMGAYSPAPFLNEVGLQEIERMIMQRWLDGCREEGIDFHGLLYPGVMLTKEGPKVLEFNARFGDPETQVYLMRLENDLVELLDASVSGNLSEHPLRWKKESAICVVLASAGYPGSYPRDKKITGLDQAAELPGVKVFHAGTRRDGKELLTAGGRVLGVTALGSTLEEARSRAYAAAEKIQFDGVHFRRDIARKALAKTTAAAGVGNH